MRRAAGAIRPLAVLRDQALKPHRSVLQQTCQDEILQLKYEVGGTMPNWLQQGGIDHGFADQDASEFRLQSAFVPCRSSRRRNVSGSSARSRAEEKTRHLRGPSRHAERKFRR